MRSAGADDKVPFLEAVREITSVAILLRLALVSVVTSANWLYHMLLGLIVVNTLNASESNVGWFAGSVALVEIPIMLAGAYLIGRVGRVPLITVGAVVYAGSLIALGFVPSMSVAWWLILPFGIGAGIIMVPAKAPALATGSPANVPPWTSPSPR